MRKPEPLRTHDFTLQNGDLLLRTLRRDDFRYLRRWGRDRKVMCTLFPDKPGAGLLQRVMKWLLSPRILELVFGGISQAGYSFFIESNGRAVGITGAWCVEEQERVWRVPIVIGEKSIWGMGYGTRAIRLLTEFLTRELQAGVIVAGDILETNERSLRLFRSCGFADVSPEDARYYSGLSSFVPPGKATERRKQEDVDSSVLNTVTLVYRVPEEGGQ